MVISNQELACLSVCLKNIGKGYGKDGDLTEKQQKFFNL